MKTVQAILSLMLLFLISGCGKKSDETGTGGGPIINTPKIVSFSPAMVTTGTAVTLTGENFGSDISKVILKLDSILISITSVSSNNIVFTVPLNLISAGSRSFNLQVFVNGIASNIILIPINFEAHGWFYINKTISIVNNRTPINMYFYNDQFGIMSGNWLLNSTTDSGKRWGDLGPSNYLGSGFHIYNEAEGWIECNSYDIFKFSYSGTSSFAKLDTITTIPKLSNEFIAGLFVTKPGYGYVLTHEGCIFKINGSFAPSNINLEFQSAFYKPLSSSTIGDFNLISGIDSMNFMAWGRPEVYNVNTPIIIHKKNGAYTEYNLSSLLGIGWVYRLQYVDQNTAYFISMDYDMYKFNFSTNTWSKITTPTKFGSFIFLNSTLGYASSGFIPGQTTRYIYKTTDGGLNWSIDFTLDSHFYAYTMATKDNKLWIYGDNGSYSYFLLKYNP